MAGLSALLPLIVLFVIVGIAGFIGYGLYAWSNELADKASKQLEAKNVSFTKDGGLRVGVKDLKEENYTDKQQSLLVNVWNNASFPNYKSHLGWNKAPAKSKTHSTSATTRSDSSGAKVQQSRSSGLRSPTQAAQAEVSHVQKRSGPNIPGGW